MRRSLTFSITYGPYNPDRRDQKASLEHVEGVCVDGFCSNRRSRSRARPARSAEFHPQVHMEPGPQGHRRAVRTGGDLHRSGGADDVDIDAVAAGLSGHLPHHRAAGVLPVHHHARDDHGDLSADGAVPRRLRQLSHSADAGRAGHGVPVPEHAQLLVLPARGPGVGAPASSCPVVRLARDGHCIHRKRCCRAHQAQAGASFVCSRRWRSSSSRSLWAA